VRENPRNVTTRRSVDLPPLRKAEPPLLANVRRFPLILPPDVVLEMARRQRERATEKAVARQERRKRRRKTRVCEKVASTEEAGT